MTEGPHAHPAAPPGGSEHHVSHRRTYLHIFAWLTILTAVEVGVVFMPLHRVVMITLLCALAIVKAALVAMFFMHLRFERKTLALVVMTPIVLAAILIIGLMPDTQSWFVHR